MTDTDPRWTTLRERGVVPLSTPLPWAQAGDINTFVLRGPPHVVVDPGYHEGWPRVQRILADEGIALDDIEAVLVTHAHPDHASLLDPLLQRASPTASPAVYLHPDERPKVAPSFVDDKTAQYRRARGWFLGEGVPEPAFERFVGRFSAETRHRFGAPIETLPLRDGQRLEFAAGTLQVVATPGHTPGHVMFEDLGRGLVYSGDHLMARISPNPVLDFRGDDRRYRGMPQYLESLERARGLRPDLWCGGHGPVFLDAAARIDSLLAFLDRRGEKILRVLDEGPARSFEVARRVFPNAQGLDVFLSFSEVVGHIDVLLVKGLVTIERRGGSRWLTRTSAEP